MAAIETKAEFSTMKLFALGLLFVSSIVFLGCSRAQKKSSLERENSHFRWLAMAYRDFAQDHRGRIPNDMGEFKKYVEKHGQQYMADKQLTIDTFFTSPRDGQPYFFCTKQGKRPAGVDVVGYEVEGSDGLRYLADSTGGVEEVAEERFRQMTSRR